MKILLTGGTGYLGSRLAKRIVSSGHMLACTVRGTQNLKELETVRDKITLIPTCEMEDAVGLFRPEIVIHTACTYAKPGYTEQDILDGNFLFPFNVLQVAVLVGVKRWINTGTCLPEDMNSYSLSKGQFCQWGKMYARAKRIQFINLQLEMFYGHGKPDGNFLTWVIEKLRNGEDLLLTDGTQRRDFIYIDDVVRVYEKLIDCSVDEPYLDIPVGTGEGPSVREVIEYLKEIICSQSNLCFGAVAKRTYEPDTVADCAKMRKYGVEARYGWREGMKKIIEQHKLQ